MMIGEARKVEDILADGKEWPVMMEWPPCLGHPLPDDLIDELQPMDIESRKGRLCEYVASTVYFNGKQGAPRFTIADPRLAKKFKKWLSRTASNLPKKTELKIQWGPPDTEPTLFVEYPRVDFETACEQENRREPETAHETEEMVLDAIREMALAQSPHGTFTKCVVKLV
jgi:hypothetical protein